MIKVRIQGTPEEMEWLLRQLQKMPQIEVIDPSAAFSNHGTSRYFRRYFQIEKRSDK